MANRGRVPVSTALLEKEIRRLTLLGQRVEEEANMRRFFLAAVLRRTGPIKLTQADIAELRDVLSRKEGDLKVEALEGDDVLLSFKSKSEDNGTKLAGLVLKHGTTPWWERMLARAKLWWWGIRLPKEDT